MYYYCKTVTILKGSAVFHVMYEKTFYGIFAREFSIETVLEEQRNIYELGGGVVEWTLRLWGKTL